jgi:hypothetical protein
MPAGNGIHCDTQQRPHKQRTHIESRLNSAGEGIQVDYESILIFNPCCMPAGDGIRLDTHSRDSTNSSATTHSRAAKHRTNPTHSTDPTFFPFYSTDTKRSIGPTRNTGPKSSIASRPCTVPTHSTGPKHRSVLKHSIATQLYTRS